MKIVHRCYDKDFDGMGWKKDFFLKCIKSQIPQIDFSKVSLIETLDKSHNSWEGYICTRYLVVGILFKNGERLAFSMSKKVFLENMTFRKA